MIRNREANMRMLLKRLIAKAMKTGLNMLLLLAYLHFLLLISVGQTMKNLYDWAEMRAK